MATLTDLLDAATGNDAEQLHNNLEDLSNRSTTTLILQEQELVNLREQLSAVKEELAESKQLLAKRTRDSERELSQCREELQDLRNRYIDMKDDLRLAQESQEYHRGKAADHWSRLQSYLSDIEGFKIREAELRAKITALEAQSSRDSLAQSELTRRLAAVMEDRDMLSNALDSKEFELELLKRGQGRRAVSQLHPSPNKAKLRVKSPKALEPTARHNTERPLMARHPLKSQHLEKADAPREYTFGRAHGPELMHSGRPASPQPAELDSFELALDDDPLCASVGVVTYHSGWSVSEH